MCPATMSWSSGAFTNSGYDSDGQLVRTGGGNYTSGALVNIGGYRPCKFGDAPSEWRCQ